LRILRMITGVRAAVTVLAGGALALSIVTCAAAQENCVLDGMEVEAAATAHRTQPRLEPSDEVGRLLLAERTLTREPVSNERLEVIKRLVEYAWSHKGQGSNPTLRDIDVSMQFERDCESGNW
jgi:hypothetical protein